MNDTTINIFCNKILLMDSSSNEQIAYHEAGHRFFWNALYPEIKTEYIKLGNGMFGVQRVDGNHYLRISELSINDASKMVYIKLGGIAAEMIMLKIDNAVKDISEFIVNDIQNNRKGNNSIFDWKYDMENGGDISEAMAIICSKVTQESILKNFESILQSCVVNLKNHYDLFNQEVKTAQSVLSSLK